MYLISVIHLLFECRADLPVSVLIVNSLDLAGLTHPVSRSPDVGIFAKTYYRTKPGTICHYDNGVKGTCMPKHACWKEQEERTGYKITWKCPKEKWMPSYLFCCPNPGEENLLIGR